MKRKKKYKKNKYTLKKKRYTNSKNYTKSKNSKKKNLKKKNYKKKTSKKQNNKKKTKRIKSGNRDYIEKRKSLDVKNWEYSYNIVKKLFNKYHDKINLFFNEIIINILVEIFKYDKYSSKFIVELKKVIEEKTKKYYITGLFDLNIFKDLLELIKKRNIDRSYIEKIVSKYLKLIRSKLNFIDFILKILSNGNPLLNEYTDKFDTCLRKRTNNFTDNNSEIKWYDELCNWTNIKDSKINKIVKKKPKDYDEDIKNLIKNCEPIYESIEPLNEDSDTFNHSNQLMTGLNIYTNPNSSDNTFGTFSAGISGHTMDISLITNLVSLNNEISSSIFVIVGAFIWMIQYYHHSIREIMMAGLINCKNKSDKNKMIELVSLLYTEINDKYKIEEIYDKIYDFFDDKLSSIKINDIEEEISSSKIKLLIEDYYKNINGNGKMIEVSDEIKFMMKDLKDIKPIMKDLKIVVPGVDC